MPLLIVTKKNPWLSTCSLIIHTKLYTLDMWYGSFCGFIQIYVILSFQVHLLVCGYQLVSLLYICHRVSHHWLRYWLFVCEATNYYPNQQWLLVNHITKMTLMRNFQKWSNSMDKITLKSIIIYFASFSPGWEK